MKRKEIIAKIIEQQQIVIQSLENSVERYKTASDLEENSTSDPEDLSHQTEAKDMQLRYEKMLRDAKNSLSFLEGELKETHTEIEDGVLISTDKNYLFVGISVSVFEFDGKEVISFSDDAPVFKEIRNKKAGDQIKFGDQNLEILSIQ